MHVYLICPYSNSIRQHNLGGATIKNDASLNSMMWINPDTGWFEITKVPMFDLDEVMGSNDE